MAIYICPHCESRNTEPGRCMVCLKKIGSLRRATIAAFASAAALAIIWIIFSAVTHLELGLFAMFFGALVSGITMRVSGGHGPMYQLVASVATILGILIADATVMMVIGHPGGFGMGNWSASLDHFATNDPYTFYFMGVGVITGLFIWRPA